jgi:hypothetical protein
MTVYWWKISVDPLIQQVNGKRTFQVDKNSFAQLWNAVPIAEFLRWAYVPALPELLVTGPLRPQEADGGLRELCGGGREGLTRGAALGHVAHHFAPPGPTKLVHRRQTEPVQDQQGQCLSSCTNRKQS